MHQGMAAAKLSADFHIGADAVPLAVVPRELQLLVTPPLIDNLIVSHTLSGFIVKKQSCPFSNLILAVAKQTSHFYQPYFIQV